MSLFSGNKANFQKWAASRPRAKAGGETVGGTHFKGGQFLSQEAMAKQFGLSVEVVNQIPKDIFKGRLGKAIERAKAGSISSMAYLVRESAVRSSKFRKDQDKSSTPGEPPHKHNRGFFRAGIRYDVDKRKHDAVVGWIHSVAGRTGATHEKGLREFVVTRKGTQRNWADFPERPVMVPALERSVVHFAPDWRSSVG